MELIVINQNLELLQLCIARYGHPYAPRRKDNLMGLSNLLEMDRQAETFESVKRPLHTHKLLNWNNEIYLRLPSATFLHQSESVQLNESKPNRLSLDQMNHRRTQMGVRKMSKTQYRKATLDLGIAHELAL